MTNRILTSAQAMEAIEKRKARQKKNMAKYLAKPEVKTRIKAKRKIYLQKPEVKHRTKVRRILGKNADV